MTTIKDVAKRAGVSPSTVSYALSGKRPISDAVKRRVARAVEQLEFSPSVLAHNLRKGSGSTVGLVFPLKDFAEETSLGFIATAAQTICSSHTLSLFTGTRTPKELLEVLRQNRADGLILMEVTQHDSRVDLLRRSGFPFTLIGRPENADGLSFVDFDFEAAAHLAVAHLVGLGHRVVGCIDFPASDHEQGLGYALYLQRGLKRAQQDFGIKLVYEESGPSVQDGYGATQRLLKRAPELSAVVALAGVTQFGVLRALADAGRRVPEDCSLVCSGAAAVAEWSNPRLSCVAVPFGELGRVGAELLLERLAGKPPRQVILPAQLLAAQSTAPAPRR